MTLDISIIARGLTPLLKPSANWLGKKMIGEEILERRELQTKALQPVLQKAAEDVAETIKQIGAADIDQICLFLTSNEAEAIVRQIYAVSILESKEQNLEEIKQEFFKQFSLYTNIPEDELEDSAPQIFNILFAGCEEALQVAIDCGRLSAHEAKSVFRNQVLLDEIATIKKNLEFLTAPQQLDISAILNFESTYRQQIKELHGKLTPPYIDVAKKLPINQLYVCPNFSQEVISRDSREKSKTQQDFYQSIHRTVLLGNPGGGKSTCAQKFCYDLVTQYKDRLLNGRQVTPILVVLRDYGAKKKEMNCSLLDFIELTAKTKYQLDSPDSAFSYLLLNGHISVIFDGLDELTETSYRQQIRDDVELFCNLFPSVPVLVTSREVGYKEAPLDEKFEVYRLASFDNQQTAEYVTKWFAIDKELTQEQQSEKVKAFLAESENLTDLRANPLMLGLMCNIYKGEGYIPRNRPDVYAKCAEMLFERWDRGRDIQLPSLVKQIESKIKPLMMYLANWIYADESLQSGVTEKRLIEKAADYLCEKRFEDRDDAECAAKAFIHFCRGRAWVFTNVGTNKHDEELYQFTHRTFLEYFTAAYLNRKNNTSEKLFEILAPKIAKQEWDVVSQLAFQIQSKNNDDAGDRLLTLLIQEVDKNNNVIKWNLLSFAVRSLEFIVPSPKISRNIVYSYLENCVNFGIQLIKNNEGLSLLKDINSKFLYSNPYVNQPGIIINHFSSSNQENHKTIIKAIRNFIIDNLNSNEDLRAYMALEIYVVCKSFTYKNRFLRQSLSNGELQVIYLNKLKYLAHKFITLSTLSFLERQLSVEDIINLYDFYTIFTNYNNVLLRTKKPSPVNLLIKLYTSSFYLDDNTNIEKRKNQLYSLSKLGSFLLREQTPFIRSYIQDLSLLNSKNLLLDVKRLRLRHQSHGIMNKIENVFDADIHFGFWLLFSVIMEVKAFSNNGSPRIFIKRLIDSKVFSTDFTRFMFIARFEEPEKYDREVEEELNKCNFNQEQRYFIWKWIRKEIDLVAIKGEDE